MLPANGHDLNKSYLCGMTVLFDACILPTLMTKLPKDLANPFSLRDAWGPSGRDARVET